MPTSTFDKKIVLPKEATERFLADLINININNPVPNINSEKMLIKNQEEKERWLSDWDR